MKSLMLAAAIVGAGDPVAVDLTRSTSGYTYFNRAGASLDAHDAALMRCSVHAGLMRQPDDNAAGAGAAGGLLGALVVGVIAGAMNGMHERRGVAANVENCMVVDGWRVVRLDPAVGEPLDALEQPDLHAALAERVGAATPDGEIARVFDNDAARGGTVLIGRSGDLDKLSLSLQALPSPTEAAPPPRRGPVAPRSARPPRPLKPEEVAIAPGQALITVRIDGMAEQGGRALLFTRAGPNPDTQPWEFDGQPALFAVGLPTRGAVRGDRTRSATQTFSVPPGRWRVSALLSGQHILHFCLGSSGFEVAAGEAVYAGAFDLAGERLGPDLSPRADLLPVEASAHGIAQRPAVYTHGDRDQCSGAYLYALDLSVPDISAPRITPGRLDESLLPPLPSPSNERAATTGE